MEKMKVLFVIDIYLSNGGASLALRYLIEGNAALEAPVVFCRKRYKADSDTLDVRENTGEELLDYYLKHGYQCVHFFHADGWTLFEQLLKAAAARKLRIPVVTTVCQKPSFLQFMLQPFEIRHSDLLVFIDKAAYGDPLYSFIPEHRKEMNYFGRTREEYDRTVQIAEAARKEHAPLVVGRASTLNKCAADMFDVFDRVDNPKKVLIIGGEHDETHATVGRQAAERSSRYEVEVTGLLPYDEYLARMPEIDIFLYHLKPDAYSSIDGTLGTAMVMGKPCVYMGPPAPAERFEHGVNGFVAKSADELVHYSNLLMHDPELRERIGRNARESIYRNFRLEDTVANYNRMYRRVIAAPAPGKVRMPLSFYRYYLDVFVLPRVNAELQAECGSSSSVKLLPRKAAAIYRMVRPVP